MKRILSLILASVMVLSLIPCVFAEETELEVKYNFDFGAAGYGSTAEIGLSTLKTYGDTDTTLGNGDTQTSLVWADKGGTDPWVVDGTYNMKEGPVLTANDASGNKKPNSLYWYMYGNRAYDANAPKTAAAVTLQIRIDKAGTYIPEITFYARKDLCIFDVYLAPYSRMIANCTNRLEFSNSALVSTVLPNLKNDTVFKNNGVDEVYLGKVDMYSATEDIVTKRLENAYEITESELETYGDKFCLFFYPNGKNDNVAVNSSGAATAQYVNIDSFKLLGEKKEISLDPEFTYSEEEHTGGSTTLRAFAVYGTDGAVSETEIIETSAVTYGNTCTISAPESVTKGDKTYNFLYWAKGATMERKKILSHSATLSYKPFEGANYLIAVYEDKTATGKTDEYYNANGELLANGDTLPSMAGYGKAIGWAEYGDGIFVAKYPELEKNISVTVDGKETKYAYGDLVTCTANAPDGKVFMYWTKDGEVITTDETYKFNAWKNCTVEAVYGDSAPTLSKAMRKIVVSSFGAGDDSVVMAEFIGLSDALEKGIMFGAKRVAMTSDKTQFAVVDDVDGEICGYAIIKENGELKIITDGKFSE